MPALTSFGLCGQWKPVVVRPDVIGKDPATGGIALRGLLRRNPARAPKLVLRRCCAEFSKNSQTGRLRVRHGVPMGIRTLSEEDTCGTQPGGV